MFIYLFIYGKCLFPWVGRQPGWAGRSVFLRGSVLIKLHRLPPSLFPATLWVQGGGGSGPFSVCKRWEAPCASFVLLHHAVVQTAHPYRAGQDG